MAVISLLTNQNIRFTLGVILVVKHMQSKNGTGSNNSLMVKALCQKAMMLFASPRVKRWVYSRTLMLRFWLAPLDRVKFKCTLFEVHKMLIHRGPGLGHFFNTKYRKQLCRTARSSWHIHDGVMVVSILFPRNYYSPQSNLWLLSVQMNIVFLVFTISKYFCLPLPHPVPSFTLTFSAPSRSTQSIDPAFSTTESMKTFRKRRQDQVPIPLAAPRSVTFNDTDVINNFYPINL